MIICMFLINIHAITALSMTTPADMMTKTVVDAPVSIESMMTNMTTIPQPQQQNMFITTSSSEVGGFFFKHFS